MKSIQMGLLLFAGLLSLQSCGGKDGPQAPTSAAAQGQTGSSSDATANSESAKPKMKYYYHCQAWGTNPYILPLKVFETGAVEIDGDEFKPTGNKSDTVGLEYQGSYDRAYIGQAILDGEKEGLLGIVDKMMVNCRRRS